MKKMSWIFIAFLVALFLPVTSINSVYQIPVLPRYRFRPVSLTYPIVDTMQDRSFDNHNQIPFPKSNSPFYKQDAQIIGYQMSYTRSQDRLTVQDNVTGLTWQSSPDSNFDGLLTYEDKLTWEEIQQQHVLLNSKEFGGYTDWRIPTIKELYSLIDFRGTDPSGPNSSHPTPFINTNYFSFIYGDTAQGERIIDSQWATSNLYKGNVVNAEGGKLFGVNFADGRIKGYGLKMPQDKPPRGMEQSKWLPSEPPDKTFFLLCVRGNPCYGMNQLTDNQDQTITDEATGLMWTQYDNGKGLNWEEALAWTQQKNKEKHLGYSDWRLPNAKELQSIVEYERCPDASLSAAIDPLFHCTAITNEEGMTDYPWYWTSTTHIQTNAGPNGIGSAAVYICFGRAMGYMNRWEDVHGAGSQRSDPKSGNPGDFPKGRGPQGDGIRIYNFVRLVRDA